MCMVLCMVAFELPKKVAGTKNIEKVVTFRLRIFFSFLFFDKELVFSTQIPIGINEPFFSCQGNPAPYITLHSTNCVVIYDAYFFPEN